MADSASATHFVYKRKFEEERRQFEERHGMTDDSRDDHFDKMPLREGDAAEGNDSDTELDEGGGGGAVEVVEPVLEAAAAIERVLESRDRALQHPDLLGGDEEEEQLHEEEEEEDEDIEAAEAKLAEGILMKEAAEVTADQQDGGARFIEQPFNSTAGELDQGNEEELPGTLGGALRTDAALKEEIAGIDGVGFDAGAGRHDDHAYDVANLARERSRSGASMGGGLAGGIEQVHMAHRHELPPRHAPEHYFLQGFIWTLVFLHLVAVAVWLRACWRQRRGGKDPTMRAHAVAPPQKVGCSYDLDKPFAITKVELPLKSMKFSP